MKKIVTVLLLLTVLIGITSCAKPDYTGVWLAFMVEDTNGKQYSMLEYFSELEDEYTVILAIKDDGTYICTSFVGENVVDKEGGTYKLKGAKIDFNETQTYTGQMVSGYLAIKYEKATMYFARTTESKN